MGPAERTRVVYNGVDLPPAGIVASRVRRPPGARPRDLAVAELRPRKGVRTLLDALPGVCAAIRGRAWRSPGAATSGRARGPAHGASSSATQSGSGPWAGVQGLLGGASTFVNPAWAEAFPYTSRGDVGRPPIVATDVGGSAEAIINGETGLVVAPREVGPLADALSSLLAAPAMRAEFASRALERYRETFTLEQMIEGTLAVYREVSSPTVETIQ